MMRETSVTILSAVDSPTDESWRKAQGMMLRTMADNIERGNFHATGTYVEKGLRGRHHTVVRVDFEDGERGDG